MTNIDNVVMKNIVTIKDVARLAKVSFKTVSRVVNGEQGVSQATANKVRDAIEELQYIPNINAKSIRTNKSQVYGFITDQIATTPFAVDIIKGAQEAASKQNKLLVVINTHVDDVIDKQAVDMLLQRHVEGIIFAAMYHKKIDIPSALSKRVNLVLVNCFSDNPQIKSIVPDEFTGGYEATSKLLEAGHKNIAILNLPEESIAAKLRFRGYQEALRANGVTINEHYIKTAIDRTSDGEINRAYDIALELLELAKPPTAIFCGNDRIAMKVYDAIKSLDMKIPDDIAVMGFDNQEIIADNLYPGLSTMALPHEGMGKRAIELLAGADDEQTSDNSGDNQILLRCDYIMRRSV